MTPRRDALFVVGMHRSGTSALARLLSLGGATPPRRLMKPMPDNPLGFWEPREMAVLNDDLLAAIDSRWDNVFAIADAERAWTVRARFLGRAAALLAEDFGAADLLAIKDPRASVLTPFWSHALETAGVELTYVISVRDPLEVAASLARRDGISTDKAMLLWTSYMVAVERDTRGHRRLFVGYDDLLDDWRAVLGRIEAALGRSLPRRSREADAAIERYLSASHRHHRAEPSALFDRPDIWAGVKTTYRWMRAAAEDHPAPGVAMAGVEAELRGLERLIGPVLASRTEEQVLTRRLAEMSDEAVCLRLDAEAEKAKVAILQRQLKLALPQS